MNTLYCGCFVDTPVIGTFSVKECVLISEQGQILYSGTKSQLPSKFLVGRTINFSDRLIIPGFADLHLHSSQLPICGLGLEKGQDWFRDYCYPAESEYRDLEYSHSLNKELIKRLIRNGITRSNIMCTTDVRSALDLFDQFLKSGLSARIGKMNSDHDAFEAAQEDTEESQRETMEYLAETRDRDSLVQPSVCPEFLPAVSDKMMEFIGKTAARLQIPVHTHMAEGEDDVMLVKNRYGRNETYGSVYERYGLLGDGNSVTAVMAHCLLNEPDDIRRLARHHSMVVHCPYAGLDSGSHHLLNVRDYLNNGVSVALGSDIGGGHTLNMMRTMIAAMNISRQVEKSHPLTFPEVFYLATKGGGSLFGRTLSFETGYQFDALVINDSSRMKFPGQSVENRVASLIYTADTSEISAVYCNGKKIA